MGYMTCYIPQTLYSDCDYKIKASNEAT